MKSKNPLIPKQDLENLRAKEKKPPKEKAVLINGGVDISLAEDNEIIFGAINDGDMAICWDTD